MYPFRPYPLPRAATRSRPSSICVSSQTSPGASVRLLPRPSPTLRAWQMLNERDAIVVNERGGQQPALASCWLVLQLGVAIQAPPQKREPSIGKTIEKGSGESKIGLV